MRKTSRLLWLLSLALLDGAAAGAFVARDVAGTLTLGTAMAVLAVHVCLSAAGGVLVVAVAEQGVGRPAAALAALGALLGLFLPGLGALGFGAAIAASQARPRRGPGCAWTRVDPSESLDAPLQPAAHRNVAAGNLIDALADRSPQNADRRFQALLQTRYLPRRAAIGVLKVALKDPSDEVRLFAFSRIERFRASLEAGIRSLHEARLSPGDDPTRVELNLAETHWELAYLGLTDGSVRTHALQTARAHAENAGRLAPEVAPIRFLLGRIQLALGDVVPASASFTRAINLGYPRRRVLPYLAECAYRRKELDAVSLLMWEVASSPQENVYLSHVREMWTS